MVDFVEPNHVIVSLWDPLKNSHRNMSLFQTLKANQQFVEILPTPYIFQFSSIYNVAGKVTTDIHVLISCEWVTAVHRQPTLASLSI